MKHKVSELEGAELDAAVALAEGWRIEVEFGQRVWLRPGAETHQGIVWSAEFGPLPWSTDWQHGGPIVERERIDVMHAHGLWWAGIGGDERTGATHSTSPLIAAMRAYVASKNTA